MPSNSTTPALAAIIGGAILFESARTGRSVIDTFLGREGDPQSTASQVVKAGQSVATAATDAVKGIQDGIKTTGGKKPVKLPRGATPKIIIDTIVVPMAKAHGCTITSRARPGAITASGNTSDHSGPSNIRDAADMSNGTQPTPQMDRLARNLARVFRIPWNGSGVANATWGGFRYQLLYRTNVGGNHFNHVHLGVARV